MSYWTRSLIGTVLTILLAGAPQVWAGAFPASGDPAQAGSLISTQPAATTGAQGSQSPTTAVPDEQKLPDSPGAVLAEQTTQPTPQSASSAPQSQTQTAPPPTAPTQQNGAPQQTPSPSSTATSQDTSQQPIGGAAAQLGRTTGGAASKPAGAALAPANQRRTRSLLLKLGVIAGAGIAVGSVAALSKASPSRPPGTR